MGIELAPRWRIKREGSMDFRITSAVSAEAICLAISLGTHVPVCPSRRRGSTGYFACVGLEEIPVVDRSSVDGSREKDEEH